MQTHFSKDIIPVTELKNNPAKVIHHAEESHRPVLLTSRGRGVAVVQSLEDFEKAQEELAFVKAVAQGLKELDEGQAISLEAVKKKFLSGA